MAAHVNAGRRNKYSSQYCTGIAPRKCGLKLWTSAVTKTRLEAACAGRRTERFYIVLIRRRDIAT
jgi:hypothetical protein